MIIIKRVIRNILLIVLIIILLIILGGLICFILIMQDDNTDKYNTQPSDAIVTELAKGAFLYNEATLSEDDINGMIASLIDSADRAGYFKKNLKINAAYLELNESEPCRLYSQINYRGFDIGCMADVDIYLFDDTIYMDFSNVYAGKLKLPKSVVTYFLKKVKLSNSYISVTPNDMSLEMPSSYSLDVENIGVSVNVEILQLDINDGEIYVRTNDILNDVLENNDLFEVFKKIIGDQIYKYVDEHRDEIIGFIEEKSEKLPGPVKDFIGGIFEN